MRRLSGIVLVLCLLALTGCGKKVLHDEAVALEPGKTEAITFKGLRKGQTVSVETSSPGVPIDVYIVLEKDKNTAMEALGQDKAPANSLAGEAKTQGKTLEAVVSEGDGVAVLLSNPPTAGKKADVKVKVTRQ
jgi:hypothetical protein